MLKILDRFQRVRHILILLNVAYDFGGLGSFGEINQVGAFDQRWYAVFNKSQVGKVHTCKMLAHVAALNVSRTEERNARRVREMQRVSVFPKILRTAHEPSDLL